MTDTFLLSLTRKTYWFAYQILITFLKKTSLFLDKNVNPRNSGPAGTMESKDVG